MRAEPPPPRPSRRDGPAPVPGAGAVHRRRCPYLEQILRERAFGGLLVRYRADCHVDARTHRFTGRHPEPPCIGDHGSCALFRQANEDEDRRIQRFTD